MPKTYAEIYEETHQQQLLRQDAADRELLAAALAGDVKAVESALMAGGRVSATNSNGTQPLHLAAGYNKPDVVNALLTAGADANAKNQYGSTPAHQAVTNDHSNEIVQMLHDAGASLKERDEKGKTPRDLAVDRGNTKLVSLFEKHLSGTGSARLKLKRLRSSKDLGRQGETQIER